MCATSVPFRSRYEPLLFAWYFSTQFELFLPLYDMILTYVSQGYLDASNPGDHLVSGTKMDLPLWVAGGLAEKGFLSCDLPKAYQEANRNILLADSSVVDLFKQARIRCFFSLFS